MYHWVLSLLALITSVCHADQLKVAIIDTGLDLTDPRFSLFLCPTGHRDFTGTGLTDVLGHGTHVTGLITKYAKDSNYCLIILKYYEEHTAGPENLSRLLAAYAQAIEEGAKIINLSGGGENYSELEDRMIKHHPNITFVVAAGNDGQNVNSWKYHYYPASLRYNNLIAVGNGMSSSWRYISSNYGDSITAWENGLNVSSTLPNGQTGLMTGTSMSCAIHTGKLIHELSK